MEKGQVFGLNIGELLTIYDHDLQLWKMSECLFTGDFGKYSEALPRSGIMLNGKIYEQATWVPRTGGKGYGLLPTPVSYDATPGGPNNHYKGLGHMAKHNPQRFSTPIKEQAGTSEKTLQMVREGKAHMTLDRYMQMFPTPTIRDWKDGTAKSCENVPVNGLLVRAIHFPTMTACEWKGRGPNSKQQGLTNALGVTGGTLNPTWIDWFMGYPIEWTDLEASEMQLSLK